MLKETRIKLQDNGKDLEFVVKQMPARQNAKWLTKAGLLLCGAGADADLDAVIQDFYGFLKKGGIGVIGNLDYDRIEPLLDELLACCWRQMDKALEHVEPSTCDAYIEEAGTIFRLYAEAFKINFLSGGSMSAFLGQESTAGAKAS